mmetsp:Transcript_18318/g.20166  ORF Transcript_18318/g.20166 Transcript_18318/m.20166 type:complete len:105 (+) Transcript_18318:163-477(+)
MSAHHYGSPEDRNLREREIGSDRVGGYKKVEQGTFVGSTDSVTPLGDILYGRYYFTLPRKHNEMGPNTQSEPQQLSLRGRDRNSIILGNRWKNVSTHTSFPCGL